MVYCGRPSKACLECRKRKLLCDLRKEGCSQCGRAKLQCSGYRNIEALRIRDETNAVQKRVHARKLTGSIPPSLSVSISCQAKDVFYQSYVVGTTRPFDFLQPYYSLTSKEEHLSRSIEAVALAYFNYQRQSPVALKEAREQYVTALSLIRITLQNSDLAMQDSTILAILLLDLYEKITTREPNFEGAWTAHLSGALTLARLRSVQQFQNPNTLRMLIRLSTNLLISCVISGRPILEELVALRSDIAAYFPESCDPKWKESDLMIECARLWQNINQGDLSDDAVISSLLDMDAKCSRLAMEVTPTWQYRTAHVDENSNHHYELHHHIYPTENAMQMWNTLRLARIHLNELICSRCLDDQGFIDQASEARTLYRNAIAIITQMASDICASVPQFIGDLSISFKTIEAESGSQHSTPADDACIALTKQPDPSHHLPCYRLIYPLYVVSQFSMVPPSVKPWAVKQLRFMAEYHAIKNAAAVANILESGQNMNSSLVYAMLGSYAFVC